MLAGKVALIHPRSPPATLPSCGINLNLEQTFQKELPVNKIHPNLLLSQN